MRYALAWLLLCAGGAAAQEMKTHVSEDGQIAIDLPKSWAVERQKDETGAKFRVIARLPGEKAVVRVQIYVLEGANLSPASQAYYELKPQMKIWETKEAAYGFVPMPHIELDFTDGVARKRLLTFTRQRGRSVNPVFTCDAELFPRIRAVAFEAAATARTKYPKWPPAKDGAWKKTVDGDVVFLAGNGVNKKSLNAVRRRFKETAKRFEKRHGKFDRPANEPLTIYVVGTHTNAVGLVKAPTKHGHRGVWRERRIVATVWKRGNEDAADDFAEEAYGVLFAECYGSADPDWLRAGEIYVQILEDVCDKRLPHVPAYFFEDYKGLTKRLDELVWEKGSDLTWDAFSAQAAAYVMFFRIGPSKYRKAYAAFLAEFRETANYDEALRHFRALDLEKLRQAAQRHLTRKLKVVAR